MNFYNFQIVLQEVPGEISLCFSISGCTLRCKGCHSPYLWKATAGNELSDDIYKESLLKYLGLATCVLFMGGEWYPLELHKKLLYANSLGYKTCLYTGEEHVPEKIKNRLNYIKTGPWIEALGGLDSKSTNQNFVNVDTNENLNYLFLKQ